MDQLNVHDLCHQQVVQFWKLLPIHLSVDWPKAQKQSAFDHRRGPCTGGGWFAGGLLLCPGHPYGCRRAWPGPYGPPCPPGGGPPWLPGWPPQGFNSENMAGAVRPAVLLRVVAFCPWSWSCSYPLGSFSIPELKTPMSGVWLATSFVTVPSAALEAVPRSCGFEASSPVTASQVVTAHTRSCRFIVKQKNPIYSIHSWKSWAQTQRHKVLRHMNPTFVPMSLEAIMDNDGTPEVLTVKTDQWRLLNPVKTS